MAKRKPAGARGRKAVRRRTTAARARKSAARAGSARKRTLRKPVPRRTAAATRASTKAAAARKKTVTRKVKTRKAVARKTARPAAVRRAVKKTARAAPRKAAAPKATRSAAKKAAPPAARRRTVVKAAAGAAVARRVVKSQPVRTAPSLLRTRRTISEVEADLVPTPPSSLDLDRTASSARTGRRELLERFENHPENGPAITGGDLDANWESAYSVGDEAPGGDSPTPDQDIVDDIGRAVGVQYEDNEELKGEEKILKRDRHRWELDPASSEDYEER